MLSLINDQRLLKGLPVLGFFNPRLYKLKGNAQFDVGEAMTVVKSFIYILYIYIRLINFGDFVFERDIFFSSIFVCNWTICMVQLKNYCNSI